MELLERARQWAAHDPDSATASALSADIEAAERGDEEAARRLGGEGEEDRRGAGDAHADRAGDVAGDGGLVLRQARAGEDEEDRGGDVGEGDRLGDCGELGGERFEGEDHGRLTS